MNEIIEGINQFLEDYRRATVRVDDNKVPDEFPKGHLSLQHNTSSLGTFGNLHKTTWKIWYARPRKKAILVGWFFLNYNPSRDDWQSTARTILTKLLAGLITGNKWKDIVYGNEVEPIPDPYN